MANILGWKDHLRPIRDGFRHLFPTPETGPTPEEREKQRRLDRAKGFTYFDTFAQLEKWTEADSDTLQRANTPLLPRAPIIAKDSERKAEVLLCHDYAGNYHDYESIQGIGVNDESYSCEYLQFVDTFIYFSHKLVCVPPPAWTNTVHRNGVKALGTLLVEPQTKGAEKLLRHELYFNGCKYETWNPMARKLVDIAKHYGFDGYLVNIEKPFSREAWEPNVLQSFLELLRDELGPEKRVIWYDALTTNNHISYQNALTPLNLKFAKSAGSILTNYSWHESDTQSSKQLAEQEEIRVKSVFFGVDVWAQNTTKLTHPRITYPEKGGGGTNTGIAVSKLADLRISVGVFAPAWSFEHFPGHGRDVERAIWDGHTLPDDMKCDCGSTNTRHPPNRGYPIVRSAFRFPAGSETFFYTDFARAFAGHGGREAVELYDGKKFHSQLGSQSLLPHMAQSSIIDDQVQSSVNVLSQRLKDLGGRTLLVVEARSIVPPPDDTNKIFESWLPMFHVNMPADESLRFRLKSRYTLRCDDTTASCYLRFTNHVEFIPFQEPGNIQAVERRVKSDGGTGRLLEIGIHLKAPHLPQNAVGVVEVNEIGISPHYASEIRCNITNVRVECRGEGDHENWRLCWAFHNERYSTKHTGIPYSSITGPFSYFAIELDGLLLGRVYATEYILSMPSVETLKSEGAEAKIIGVGFDGRTLAESVIILCI